nr:MAG TPA: hypothetical protein [Caudoviricetes sp.]
MPGVRFVVRVSLKSGWFSRIFLFVTIPKT